MKQTAENNEFENAWYSNYRPQGVDIAHTFDEIKQFAYTSFDDLDQDKDGFLSRSELQAKV